MDLNTIHNNYEAGQYSTWHDLNDDFELIVSNCHQFNPATSPPSQDADRLKLKWLQAWMQAKQGKTFKEPSKSKAPELSPYEKQKRAMQAGMKALCKTDQERGSIFATPVDPIRLNIPDYFEWVAPRVCISRPSSLGHRTVSSLESKREICRRSKKKWTETNLILSTLWRQTCC